MRGPTHIMTLNDTNDTNALALPNFQALIARHGALAVGFAYLRAALARRPHPPDLSSAALSDHMLRDIGLMPRASLTEAKRRGWDF